MHYIMGRCEREHRYPLHADLREGILVRLRGFHLKLIWVVLGLPLLTLAEGPVADARRGGELFVSLRCNNCHSAGGGAPMLGSAARVPRGAKPADLVTRMWNHAPAMWTAMRKSGIEIPMMTEAQAGDLFAYLYASRYFDPPGDAARGKRTFAEKGCAKCHSPSADQSMKWKSITDPVDLVHAMMTHSRDMGAAVRRAGLEWPQLSGQDVSDVLTYVQNLPSNRKLPYTFAVPPASEGAALAQAKGCAKCHNGGMALETRLAGRTLSDIAASMWNHAPEMMPMSGVTGDELRQILTATWFQGYMAPRGQADKGEQVFNRRCASCHSEVSGVGLKAGSMTGGMLGLTSSLWNHGPKMAGKTTMDRWPTLRDGELTAVASWLAGR